MRNDVTFAPQWARDAELDLRREDRLRLVRRIVGLIVCAVILAGGIGYCVQALAQPALDKPAFVVATPALRGIFRGTVMLAAPVAGGHVGLVLNRPSKFHLKQLFPDHPPSAAVVDPVYHGGTTMAENVGALIRADAAPGPRAIEIAPGVWFTLHAPAVDHIIETTPNAARYYAGFVVWRPGELAAELEQGMFVLRPLDPEKIFLPDTSNLWHDLSPRKGQAGT